MTKDALIHVIWELPVILFKTAREKVRTRVAERENEEARWLNG